MIAHKLFTSLEPEHRNNLDWHWYVGRDMTKPINNKLKLRSCHSLFLLPFCFFSQLTR